MNSELTTENIQQQLEEFTINVDDVDILFKMQELCIKYHKSAEDIALAWVAFFSSRNIDREPTLETLGQLERVELSKPKRKCGSRKEASTPQVSDSDDVLQEYSTPNALKRLKTPEVVSKRRLLSLNDKPVPLTPKTTYPTSTTPSQKYSSRTGRRTVLKSFGHNKVDWKGDNWRVNISVYDKTTCLDKKYRYMFGRLFDRVCILNGFISELADQLQKFHLVEEWSSLEGVVPGEITVVGRIFCDQQGKMNASSVWIEGSYEIASGRSIQLTISGLLEVSLFPGQVIALKGIQNQGRLAVKEVLGGVLLPKPMCQPTFPSGSSDLQIVLAAGPFTTSDTLSYEPLDDLLEYVTEFTPHVLILIGPFVDIKHSLIKKGAISEPYLEMFEHHVVNISQKLASLGTQWVMVPSLRDIHHENIYPIPPFALKQKLPNVHCFSEPCTLNIEGLVIGISSTDILFHLGKEELSYSLTDRMGRLCHHILSQHNFYPLYPPADDVSIDYEHFEQHAALTVTPHLMVIPSDLRYFIKDVDGCCFINPERLAKGITGGTFCRIMASFGEDASPLICAEVLKI